MKLRILNLMLHRNDFISRYFAPNITAFGEKSPSGEQHGSRSFSQGQGLSFENLRQKREAQDQGEIRVLFLLDTFLWTSTNSPEANLNSQRLTRRVKTMDGFHKEKYLACRCENRIQHKPVAIATLILMALDEHIPYPRLRNVSFS